MSSENLKEAEINILNNNDHKKNSVPIPDITAISKDGSLPPDMKVDI